MVYAAQQRLDGYEATVRHAIGRKRTFDKRVLKQSGEVIFEPGQLVQVYRSDLDYTFKTERKLLPKWSPPYRIHTRIWNAYTLEDLDGTCVDGEFSARRLRAFIPKEGTRLADTQKEWEAHKRNPGDQTHTVQTPLFMRGEHGIGGKVQGGQKRGRDEVTGCG
jgi:hypothetical protein